MKITAFLFFVIIFGKVSLAQTLYFPPLNNASAWAATSPASLGWCTDEIDSLYDYLQKQDTKGFILLKNGKIVLEKYFGNFTQDSIWYWASAGKTLTSFLIGKAREENYLNIAEPSSKYLGKGWTDCPDSSEDKITIRNQLTMTTGLDDGVPDNHCTTDTCLKFKANSGKRWAYHNAPYTLLEDIIQKATGFNVNTYTNLKLKAKTGITGIWATIGFDNVFFSKVRSMARFGLLIQNDCIWQTDTLLRDKTFIKEMTGTSQNINLSYGYLWWLNGKASYMLPTTQYVFPGNLCPAAPTDMVAGLGRNGQILSISKSLGLVFVRMGNKTDAGDVPNQLCDKIWEKLNSVMCNATMNEPPTGQEVGLKFFPNPSTDYLIISELPGNESFYIDIYNSSGRIVLQAENTTQIDLNSLPAGVYHIRFIQGENQKIHRLIKI